MSEESQLGRMAARLAELAAMLRDPSLDDERAAELAAGRPTSQRRRGARSTASAGLATTNYARPARKSFFE
jgi:hypothetical protein